MKKWFVIGISIIAAILLALTSLTNVIGYQTVQSSHQQIKKEAVNQRELLFQTIVDITHNKEIQRIILKSQITRGIFLGSEIPVITKNQIKRMYFIGLILSKSIGITRIQSFVRTHQFITPEIQQEITAVIERDPIVQDEITQLLNSDWGCEKSEWGFPIICTTLVVMMGVVLFFWLLLALLLSPPPSAIDEMLDLLVLLLGPLPILYQRFNCPIPGGNDFPVISDISPADGEQNVLLNLTELSFRLTDQEGDLMSYMVTTNPDIGKDSAKLVSNGTYTIPVHEVQHSTQYTWKILLYEGGYIGIPRQKTFTFTTAPIAPVISNPIPKHNAAYVPIFTSQMSFDLLDHQGDLMNWTVETQPDIGSGGANGVSNGRYAIAINGLEYDTTYTWFVNATDGANWTNETFVFTTTSEGLLVLEPSADTYVSDLQPNTNFGGGWWGRRMELSYDNVSYSYFYDSRAMVLFNLSSIPANPTVISAKLNIYYYDYDTINPSGREITCHRILKDWNETNVTYNTMPDSDPVECASTHVPTYFTWVEWNVTSEVDDFINGGFENNGWMIRDYKNPVEYNCNHWYYSSDANNDYSPRLFVWFNSP